MSLYVEKFINQLIKKIDKPEGVKHECKIHVTEHAYRWYFALNNSTKTALHQTLGSVTHLKIYYQRKVAFGAFKHIEYVQITNGQGFMESQKITPLSDEIQVSFQHLRNAQFNVPWWSDTKSDIAQAWSNNKAFYGVKRNQADRLFDAMKLVERIVQSPDIEPMPDIRTLSARLYGDSKKLENKSFANLIRKLMLPHLNDDVVALVEDGTKLLEYLGISKYPIPIRFKATGRLHCRGVIDLSALHYGIGVSPDEVKDIEWSQRPEYVLFIENRASFERYVREIDDAGVIIYTAGFPPRSWMRAMEVIMTELRGAVPIYHWGDRDAGGYRILAFLAKRLNTDIQPHLMGVDAQTQTLADDEIKEKPVVELMQALESARDYPSISALYDDLAKFPLENLPWIEQEQITPLCPLKL
jgi:hypothetical protein